MPPCKSVTAKQISLPVVWAPWRVSQQHECPLLCSYWLFPRQQPSLRSHQADLRGLQSSQHVLQKPTNMNIDRVRLRTWTWVYSQIFVRYWPPPCWGRQEEQLQPQPAVWWGWRCHWRRPILPGSSPPACAASGPGRSRDFGVSPLGGAPHQYFEWLSYCCKFSRCLVHHFTLPYLIYLCKRRHLPCYLKKKNLWGF